MSTPYCIHLLTPCSVTADGKGEGNSPHPLRLLPRVGREFSIPQSTVQGALKYAGVDPSGGASAAMVLLFPLRSSLHGFYLGTSKERLQRFAELLAIESFTNQVNSLPDVGAGEVLTAGEVRGALYFEEFHFPPKASTELRTLAEQLARLLSSRDRALHQKIERGIALLEEEQLLNLITIGTEFTDRVPSHDLTKHELVQYLPSESVLFGSWGGAPGASRVLFLGREESAGKGLSRFITNFNDQLPTTSLDEQSGECEDSTEAPTEIATAEITIAEDTEIQDEERI